MFPPRKNWLAALVLAALAPLLSTGPAQAQSLRRPSRLTALRQQNALQQQQNAVQAALQQTTALQQSANGGVTQVGMLNGMVQQGGTPNPINFQMQQSALEIAVQQTTALLQTSFRQNSALSQMALRQLNTLQAALQQTTALQSSLSMQGGQLTALQLQTLSQEQSNLMGLLTSQIPPTPGGMSRSSLGGN